MTQKNWTVLAIVVSLCCPGCGAEVTAPLVHAITAAAVMTSVIAIAVADVENARAAHFDAERRELELELRLRSGQIRRERLRLTEDQTAEIARTRKAMIRTPEGRDLQLVVN